jgi:hypothetical protein
MEQKATNLQIIDTWRQEITGYWEQMVHLGERNDVEVILRTLSMWSARSGYMHSATVRSNNKLAIDFRTKEIDYFHDEVDRQFKIWSRVATVVQSEWESTR